MKKMKHMIAVTAAAAILFAGSITVMAANYESPADIVSDLTGRTVDEIITERFDTGKTLGTIAKEAGKLDEFKEASLDLKRDRLNEDVENGLLTKEEADEILEFIKERQITCDGTGNFQSGYCGGGRGQGRGRGMGQGRGLRNGSCMYNN